MTERMRGTPLHWPCPAPGGWEPARVLPMLGSRPPPRLRPSRSPVPFVRFLAWVAVAAALATPLAAQEPPPDEPDRFELFPRGHLFAPLIAAPREPQFRNSYLWARSASRDLDTRIAVTEPGGTLSLLRRRGARPGDGIELSIQASVAAQFDMASAHWDLLNADYTFSYPLSWRRGATSARFRFYHQSSHLGDEFLTFREPRPEFTESFRIESVDLMVARDVGRWRLYGGGEHAYSAAPAELARTRVQAGVEHTRPLARWGRVARAGPIVAANVSAADERGWTPGVSVRTGFEVGRGDAAPGERHGARYRALLEFYSGPAPYGQFFRFDRVTSIGVGCYVVP